MQEMNFVQQQIDAVLRGISFFNTLDEKWYLQINIGKLTTYDIGTSIIEQVGYSLKLPQLKQEDLMFYGLLPNSYLFTLDMLEALWASYVYIMQKWYYRQQQTLILPAIKIEQLL